MECIGGNMKCAKCGFENKNTPVMPDDSNFNEFWRAYPRKTAKHTARRAWVKAGVQLSVAIKALEIHKRGDQWSKDGGRFIPHAATWLNQKRWEDEITTKGDKYAHLAD
jgi:DNA replication protein DnaC